MQSKFFKFQILSILFAVGLGTLLHFTFEWSNNNTLVSIFSAVNESVWEHLKILFFPMLLTTVLGLTTFQKEYPSYLCNKTKGIFLSMILIIVFHYTYSGIIGTHIALVDIVTFILAIIIGELYTYKKTISISNYNNKIAFLTLFITGLAFIIFTFNPPHIGIFKDPSTGLYGFQKTEN